MKIEVLKELLTKNGITQRQLAEHLGLARTTVTGYVSGEREPNHSILLKMADYFGVTVDLLLGRDDDLIIVEKGYSDFLDKEEISKKISNIERTMSDLNKELKELKTKL
jgi:transcriptional regulator with XRE-family HTH domain